MEKVYLDNNVVSAISKKDHKKNSPEQDAIAYLLGEQNKGTLTLGTSRHSTREMELAPRCFQAELKTGLSGLEMAKDDHEVLGFQNQTNRYGSFCSCPVVSDIVDGQLYSDLLSVELERDDAIHLMYAVHNGYQRFLTCDGGILSKRCALKKICPSIQIQKPSEFVAELKATVSGH